MPKTFTYTIRFALFAVLLSAYSLLAGQNGNSWLFNNIKVKDGLPVDQIFTLTQDSTGFMWFGTINGLIRYDGYAMQHFRHDQYANIALPDNQITAIEHDGQNGMWVACYQGLIHFDTRTWQSKVINLGGSCEVRCLLNQGDSVLWIGTASGLFKLNTQTHDYTVYNQQNSPIASNIVRSLFADSMGNIWVGTFDGLNCISSLHEWTHFDLKGNYKPELKNNLVLAIQPYSKEIDSLLWIGTETGLVLFNRNDYTSRVFNSSNTGFGNEVVKCILPLDNGRVFFGTDFGFYNFDSKTLDLKVSIHDPFNNYSLANNVVWDIYRDNAGIVWLATANGISRFSTDEAMFKFTPVYNVYQNMLIGNQVNDLYVAPDNVLWLATKKGVEALYPSGKREVFTADNPPQRQIVLDNINTITGDNLGRIWIGSAGGINVWDTQKQKMYTITANFDLNKGLRSNYISAFITPPDGSFWVGTWGGGMYKAKGNFLNVDEIYFEYVANFNTNIYSADDKIWLKHDKKVYNIDLSTMHVDLDSVLNKAIGQKEISSLLVATNQEVWLGLNNQVLQYNPHTGKVKLIDVLTGKPCNISNLVEDFDGNIWGTSLTSIFRYSIHDEQIESFPMKRGIPLDIFLSQSNTRSKSGELFFGGNDGFISFNPDDIRKNMFSPQLVISGIRVNNKEINSVNELKGKNKAQCLVTFSDEVILKYDQHSISINFSALHFGDPERNIYAYKLEGYDKEWNYTTGTQNTASYSYLSPNKYRFIVKGTNNDGVWSENQAVLSIIVKPPVWASPWAIVIYLIVFQLILFALVITYRNKHRWKEQIRQITLEKEKNEMLAQAKQQFFTNISHEFRTPLNLITGPVQTLIGLFPTNKTAQGLLQIISKNSRRLLSLVNQLMDLREIENKSLELIPEKIEIVAFCNEQYQLFSDLAQSRTIHFEIELPEKELIVETDRQKLEAVIQNLLSNAFKFTPAGGKIALKLEFLSNKQYKIVVSDSGRGIDDDDKPQIFNRFHRGKNTDETAQGYGIGLNLAKEYCTLMKGSIHFESQLDKGSVFWIEMPYEQTDSRVGNSQNVSFGTIDNSEYLDNLRQLVDNNSANKPLVLLVDDNPDMHKYIRLSLSDKYSFCVASKVSEAMRILEKNSVDIIVTDIMMPEVDGLSFCEQIKKDHRFSQIPVIMLTAMALASQQVKGFKAGADAYITKPFNIEVLAARIDSLLSRNQKTDEYIKRSLIIENQQVNVDSADEKLLKEAIEFINTHISHSEINIDKMCKQIGISHSSLYRKVKAQTGMSLNELIRHVKMKKAAQLIKTKKFTIAEIMDQTGFSSHSYFAKCFKKEFNVSPREYQA
ncbi:MAG TPA: two-component regulator propeller domain-containing protein [Prolixibacteraceae bacterium]|nr:two-component regulator propeller domain-containing protein [Prolixibacteraceae bacterium]